jgi:hypothetical protein
MSRHGFTPRFIVPAAIVLALLGPACKTNGGDPGPTKPKLTPPSCDASRSWITSPKPPEDIGGNIPVGEETNCQFQQFAYQWFLHLVQPQASNPNERVFEALRIWQLNKTNQCNLNQKEVTGRAKLASALFAQAEDQDSDDFQPALPVLTRQALSNSALYDQKGNVVFYSILYDSKACSATREKGFEPNTIEIKTSWRQLDPGDPNLSRYYVINTPITDGTNLKNVTLGLVGFHLIIHTAKHPEFVWATFEHVDNAPDCTKPQQQPGAGWSFTSGKCAECLLTQTADQCAESMGCEFHKGVESGGHTSDTSHEVCRFFRNGTPLGSMTNDNNNDVNRANIDMLNEQLVGPSGLLTQLPASDPMAVWKNYFLVGSLWTEGGKASTDEKSQRGSLNLSNTTMETFLQKERNCFSCHRHDPDNTKNWLGVSKIAEKYLLPPQVTTK